MNYFVTVIWFSSPLGSADYYEGAKLHYTAMVLLVINERVGADLAALARLPSREHVGEFCRQALEALGSGAKRAPLRQAAQLLSLELDLVSGAIMALSLLFVEAAKVRARHPFPPPPCPPPPPPAAAGPEASLLALTLLRTPHTQSTIHLTGGQRNCSTSDLAMSMGDIPIPEDSKREVSDFYGAHLGELREGLGFAAGSGGGGSGGEEEGGAAAAAAAAATATATAPGPALAALGVALARQELQGGAGALLPASGASATLPEYRSLEWRLEVEVSRRAAHGTLAPSFLLQLGVAGLGPEAEAAAGGSASSASSASSSGGSGGLAASGPHAILFSADFQALKRASASLATAGLERSKAHVKRVYKI